MPFRFPSSIARWLAALAIVLSLLPASAKPAAATNLLQNGMMESFYVYGTGSGDNLTVATGWHIFVESGQPYFMDNVQFAYSHWGMGWVEGYEGEHQQMIFTPNGPAAFVAGLYQQVSGVTSGVAYAFSGRFLVKARNALVGKRLGMDPYGGTDPYSPNIIWGWQSWGNSGSGIEPVYMAEIARASTITLFIRVDHPVSDAANSETWLDAYILEQAPVAHTNALPLYSQQTGFTMGWGLDWVPPDLVADGIPDPDWYQVQLRDGGGPWVNWLAQTGLTSQGFGGQDCHTYYVQTRALVVHAVAAQVGTRLPSYWPGGDGQTHITIITAPPVSAVSPLAAYRPAAFAVTWSGSPGSCGLFGYDVQVRDGPAGAWVDWLSGTTATSATFTGQGGHTYYFRSRARGLAGYLEAWSSEPDAVATVDTTPPLVSVSPLPDVETSAGFPVSWSASDGASGVASYDVQVRPLRLSDDADLGWRGWLTATTAAQAAFFGEDGFRYAFRVTARDALGNAGSAEAATNVLLTPAPVLATSGLIALQFALPGATIGYAVTLSNTGNLGTDVSVEDALPIGSGVLLTETLAASSGAVSIEDGELHWQGAVAAGAAVTVTYSFRLDDTLAPGHPITNTAEIADGVHQSFERQVVTVAPYLYLLPLVARP